MRLARVDLYFLHSNIAPDDYAYAHGDARRDQFSTKWSLYENELVPAFEALKARGKIGAWGITGVGVPDTIDRALSPNRPDAKDYERAAPFRDLCKRWGEDPALVAHRYALSIPGVDTVVLGVKNRAELRQTLEAERAGNLSATQIFEIDSLRLRL